MAAADYCTIYGGIIGFLDDGPDNGNDPDIEPITGTITVTPVIAPADHLLYTPAGSDPKIAVPFAITVNLDDDGNIIGRDGTNEIRILGSGSPLLDGAEFQARIDFSGIKHGTTRIDLKTRTIDIPAGEKINLATAVPVTAPGTTPITKGDTGDSAYDIWLAAGNTGTEADFLESLKGKPLDPTVWTTLTPIEGTATVLTQVQIGLWGDLVTLKGVFTALGSNPGVGVRVAAIPATHRPPNGDNPRFNVPNGTSGNQAPTTLAISAGDLYAVQGDTPNFYVQWMRR